MILYVNEKRRCELLKLIESNSASYEIKRLLISFIIKGFELPFYKTDSSKKRIIWAYWCSIKLLIEFTKDYTIYDISWSNFCFSLPKVYYLDKFHKTSVTHLFREFFKYIVDNIILITDEVLVLKTFKHFLDVPCRPKLNNGINLHPVVINEIYSNFGLNSIPAQLYLYETLPQSKTKEVYQTLINLNSNNNFVKEILIDYIESFTKDTINIRTSRIVTLTIFRQFVYYFERSLYTVNDTDIKTENNTSLKKLKHKKYTSIVDFDFKTFSKQFRFYNLIDKKFPVTREYKKSYGTYKYCLIDILKSFYVYLYNYIQDNSLYHDPFEGTGIDKTNLMSSIFNSYFKEGYFYIRDNRLQNMPKRNRIAVVITQNSERARGLKQKIRSFDFTKLLNYEYKDDFMNFIWNSNNSLSRRNNIYLYVLEFLNFKFEWSLEHKNIINIYNNTLFLEDFMFSYRLHIQNKYNSNSTMDSAVLAVKKYLKYYKNKYTISDFTYKYLNCFDRVRNGGNPIPNDDFNLLIKQFRDIKGESIKEELCFIVFYLCSTSKLRLGTILNLQRNCIINVDKEKNVGTIKFYSKTSDRNYDTEILVLNCINFIKRAIELTSDTANKIKTYHKEYIFILQSKLNKTKYGSFNVIFLGSGYNRVFLDVQKKVGLANKYTPYQVRHTRKNKLYEEANKKGYSELEINEMIGGTLQVNLKNYIKKNNTELYIEIFTGVTISNVDINGKILLDDSLVDSLNSVTNNLGGCENESCKTEYTDTIELQLDDTYKCLICDNFITCTSRLIVFEKEINSTKEEFESSAIGSYRTFSEAKLKLLGAFYKKLIDLKT